jgi:hypothetical protein
MENISADTIKEALTLNPEITIEDFVEMLKTR